MLAISQGFITGRLAPFRFYSYALRPEAPWVASELTRILVGTYNARHYFFEE